MTVSLFLALGVLPAPVDHAAILAGGSVYELLSPSENSDFEMVASFQNLDFLRQQAKRVSFPNSGVL